MTQLLYRAPLIKAVPARVLDSCFVLSYTHYLSLNLWKMNVVLKITPFLQLSHSELKCNVLN